MNISLYRIAFCSALLFACTTDVMRAGVADEDIDLARTVLMDSIAFPTVEGRGEVPKLARYYADVLKKAGFGPQDILITPHGETVTMEVTLAGRESSLPPLLLNGHMDVVEADPADWERDPFVPVEEDGFIFGRGASDNKFGIAMMITTLARMKREGFEPRQDVVLLLTGDEETSMETTQVLADKYRGAQMVLNSDAGGGVLAEDGHPLYYEVQAGEKTYLDLEVEFTGPGGHSSRPSKPNAITQLAQALVAIGDHYFEPRLNDLTRASLQGMAQQVEPRLAEAMQRLIDDPADQEALAAIRNDPEYVGQIGTTCVATMVKAGHAVNALPQKATASINCRVFPGDTEDQVMAELARVVDNPSATLRVTYPAIAAPASPLTEDLTDAVALALETNFEDLVFFPTMSAYATDSTHFRAAGIPSYGVAGLYMKPTDSFAHGLNERVPVSSIPLALKHWDVMIRELTQ